MPQIHSKDTKRKNKGKSYFLKPAAKNQRLTGQRGQKINKKGN